MQVRLAVNFVVLICVITKYSTQSVQYELEMWANAQPDGRPAEYERRSLADAHY